jgi:hypothetical protein
MASSIERGSANPARANLPMAGQLVVVVCLKYGCLGYIDEDGHWRDAASAKEILDVVGWRPLNESD